MVEPDVARVVLLVIGEDHRPVVSLGVKPPSDGGVTEGYSPHLSTNKDGRVGEWAAANNVEFAYVPTNASFLNRIECHFAALRYFALDGTDHRNHDEQNS